jgi:RND family efflux transporter MFP subunit
MQPPTSNRDRAPAPPDRQHDDHGGDENEIPTDLKQPSTGLVIVVVIAFAILLAGLFVVGFVPSYREEQASRQDARDRADRKPVVSIMLPKISTGEKQVILPCNVTANQSTAIYTRTNGYLKKWYFDIGSHVDAGQLMADIETPEVDAQLAQSKATLEQNKANVVKAQADLDLARKTLDRYLDSQRASPGSVTKEQIDQQQASYDDAVAALKQVQASVTQAEANVQQLQVTVNFEHVFAPFGGTVTARNYDVGALLSPTNTGAGSEIFDLAQTDPLRVFVNVPQSYANNIKTGQQAFLKVRNFPTEFEGKVALTAGAVDPNTRTLRVQINFPNQDGKLFPGEYGEIRLPVTPQVPVSIIPTSALIFNAKGLQVATLQPGNKVHFKGIKVGRDFGTEIEVTSGLASGDQVITNPGERVVEGAEVELPKTAPGEATAAKPVRAATAP